MPKVPKVPFRASGIPGAGGRPGESREPFSRGGHGPTSPMPSLLDLYRPMLEVAGRNLSLHDFPDDVKVEWDRFSQENGIEHASFTERDGRIYANTKGRGWFEWDGRTWRRAEKPGPNTGKKPGRYTGYLPVQGGDSNGGENWEPYDYEAQNGMSALQDIVSKDFTGLRNNVTRAATRSFGADWQQVIDGAYGPGSVKRMLSDMWRHHWTDQEAFLEVGHYVDVARQGMEDQYPLTRIGPRYDMPRDEWDNPDNDPNDERWIRRRRIADPDYYGTVMSSS